MRKITNRLFLLFLFTGIISIGTIVDVQAQVKAYRVADRSVQSLLTRIETRTDTYKRDMNTALDQSRFEDSNREDMIMNYINEFENATDELNRNFQDKRSTSADVSRVLNQAAAINDFMTANRLTTQSQRNWGYLKTDLNTLARYYNVSFNWQYTQNTPPIYNKPYRVSDTQVKTLLTAIERKTDNFRRNMNTALDRSTLNNTNREDEIFGYITEFENSTDALKRKFDANQSVSADVQAVLSRASSINYFMNNNNFINVAERNWVNVRSDLDVLAGYYNVAFDWTKMPVDSTLAYTATTVSVRNLLTQLESKTDVYKRQMNTALDRSVLNNSRSEDAFIEYITSFENSTDRLKQNFDANRSTDADVQDVLAKAVYIDTFMRDYRLMNSAERQWGLVKTDLNTLSNYYAVSWDWNRPYEPMTKFDTMLTGTYRLNSAMSDDVNAVVENTVRGNSQYREQQLENNLKRRLASPEMIALEKSMTNISIASSVAPRISFRADGVTRTETTANGRTVKITSTTTYDGVSLSYEGDQLNDFYVNFVPMSDGRLRVIRRINLDARNQTVTVASVYDKVNQVAQFDRIGDYPNLNDNTAEQFYVPNNTQLTAVLRTGEISTKTTQVGDRFTMEVTSPSNYQGAIIEGQVVAAKRSGLLSGRANVSLDFDTITLRNGQTYQFAGLIENVTLANGDRVDVNNEGEVRDGSQTKETVTRTGIGAGVGAIIGAILGGGDGALIGAGIGAGAGAGTVIAQGRDDIVIQPGSQFAITATAPANVSSNLR